MKTLLVFLITATAAVAQVPDPYPLETRVKNLEDRVSMLEKGAMTIGVKANQYATYDQLRDAVKAGSYATMAVGTPNAVADYYAPSGFMGLSDGVWSLFPGEPMMVKRFGSSALGAQTELPVARAVEYPTARILEYSPANFSSRATTCVNGVCTTESSSVSTRSKLFPNAPWNR